MRQVVEGHALILINDGKLLEEQVRRAGLSDDLVMQAVREHGFEHASDVRVAILEVDGTISIVPIGTEPIRTRKRLRAVKPGGN